MSRRTHFWLRIAGLVLILVAEFGPRFWSAVSPAPSARVVVAARGR